MRVFSAVLCGVIISLCGASLRADEGMWLINRPPVEALKKNYNFEPTAAWLEHVQKSCVRLSDGGSASLVSPDGLVMTNHHVASGQLASLSTKEHDLLKDGFLAKSPADELKCADLEADIVWSIEDVTAKVNDAASGKPAAEAGAARRARISEIEKEAEDRTRLQAQVVTLYGGGLYHLYLYKRYTDLRLVFAPESEIASFGGDVDNFEYPRFNLDVTFLRIYDNDKPLKSEQFLRFSSTGASDGELVFVAGNPGSTQRQLTMDHLRFMRDIEYPARLGSVYRREVQLSNFVQRDSESARIGIDDLLGYQNSRKALAGKLAGLLDPKVMQEKARAERDLRDRVDASPEARAQWGSAWEDIAKSRTTFKEFQTRYALLESRRSVLMSSDLFRIARGILRMTEEKAKPSGERLSEYRDSNLESVELDLFSTAPIHEQLEINRFASGLSQLAETLGADDPVVLAALGGLSPQERAELAVRRTELKDPDFRRRLAGGGPSAVAGAGKDPMMAIAIALDTEARMLRKRYEDEIDGVERLAYARISAARFALIGNDTYPDATFTLRLAIGTIKGWKEGATWIPPFTTFGGLFARMDERKGEAAFTLPDTWTSRRATLNPDTPFNFVLTNDIVGGNSGSPVINKDGEAVGLIFDGNNQSLVWDVAYEGERGRSVAVDTRAIITALRDVYGAQALADEITKSPATAPAVAAAPSPMLMRPEPVPVRAKHPAPAPLPEIPDQSTPDSTMTAFVNAMKRGDLDTAVLLSDPGSNGHQMLEDAAESLARATEMARQSDDGEEALKMITDFFAQGFEGAKFEEISVDGPRAQYKFWKSSRVDPEPVTLSQIRGQWFVIVPHDVLNFQH